MKCRSVQSSKRRNAWIRFHRIWIATTLVLIAIISPAATPDSPFDRAAWQQDYSDLKDALQGSYANLAWFGSVQGMLDLPALDRLTIRSLAQAENDAQAKQILLSFVASFRDGHFSRLPGVEAAPSKAVAPKPALLDTSDASAGCAALGYSSDSRVSFSLPFESLVGFKLESDGLVRAFRAGVLTIASGQRIGILRIPSFHATQYASECEAVLRASAKPKQLGDKEAIAKDIEQHWYATLAQQLKTFCATGVSAVLVDIGQNGGGDDSGDIAARLFSKNTVRSARLLMTQATGTQVYLDEQIHALQQATEKHVSRDAAAALSEARAKIEIMRTQLTTEPCDLSWVWKEQREWNDEGCKRLVAVGSAGGLFDGPLPNLGKESQIAAELHWPERARQFWGAWSGPTYLLTDGKTYSAAEMFAATMRDNGIAKTIGTKTGGDGCGFMTEVAPVVLPQSRLRFRIPNCVRLRRDGSDEVAGISADFSVAPREGEDKAARAARVIEIIANELAAYRH